MAVTEQEVKNIIISVLSSTPSVSTISRLENDYKEIVGTSIPYHVFNYNSLEHFLRSMPDTCTIKGTGHLAECYPVLTNKSGHINELVSKQKVNNKPKKKSPTKGMYARYRNSGNASSRQQQRNIGYKYQQTETNEEKQKSPYHHDTGRTLKKNLNLLPQKFCNRQNPSKLLPNNACVNEVTVSQKKESFPPINCLENSIGKLKLTDEDSDSTNVPKVVQNNLSALINQFPDGIWCSDLPQQYMNMFNINLIYDSYGYSSLIDMCVALKHIFHYVRPGRDDFKLYPRDKPLPSIACTKYTISSYTPSGKIANNIALPDLDWTDFRGFIPKDICEYGRDIPRDFLPESAKEGDVLDVVVVEIYDPSKFWIYLGTSQEKTPLDNLMDEMQLFYNDAENKSHYSIPIELVKEGLYCVQIIFGEYHRGKIVKLLPDNFEQVRVFFIDYGTVCKVPIKGMCFLQTKFAALKSQAIRCRLSNISPKVKFHPWPQTGSEYFRNMLNRKDTKFKITAINRSDEYVCGFLADITDVNKITYINELLVNNGHAIWDDEEGIDQQIFMLPNSRCKVEKLHLFPTFLELEYGLVPNGEEMNLFEFLLTPFQFTLPEYFILNEAISDREEEESTLKESFIETIKNNRKYIPLNKFCATTYLIKDAAIDFDFFGELDENDFMESSQMFWPERNNVNSDLQNLFKDTMDLSQVIIQKLDKLNITEDHMNSENTSLQNVLTFKMTDSVPNIFEQDYVGSKSTERSFDEHSEHNIFDSPDRFTSPADHSDANIAEQMSPNYFLEFIDVLAQNLSKLKCDNTNNGNPFVDYSDSETETTYMGFSRSENTQISPFIDEISHSICNSERSFNRYSGPYYHSSPFYSRPCCGQKPLMVCSSTQTDEISGAPTSANMVLAPNLNGYLQPALTLPQYPPSQWPSTSFFQPQSVGRSYGSTCLRSPPGFPPNGNCTFLNMGGAWNLPYGNLPYVIGHDANFANCSNIPKQFQRTTLSGIPNFFQNFN